MLNLHDPLVQVRGEQLPVYLIASELNERDIVTSVACSSAAILSTLCRIFIRRKRLWVDDVRVTLLSLSQVPLYRARPLPSSLCFLWWCKLLQSLSLQVCFPSQVRSSYSSPNINSPPPQKKRARHTHWRNSLLPHRSDILLCPLVCFHSPLVLSALVRIFDPY